MNPNIQHIAIIMDGNRRWAKNNGCSYEKAYQEAVNSIKNSINVALDYNISYLTLFAFSTDNNQRSIKEIIILKKLMNNYIATQSQELIDSNIKVNIIGNYSQFDKTLAQKLDNLKAKTKSNTKLILTIALNYSGKADIIRAIQQLVKDNPNLPAEDISEKLLSNYLYTKNIPDPDIVIRTGSNSRISNFLLWQISYSELFFLDIMWPDFNQQTFIEILKKFKEIERKYGK